VATHYHAEHVGSLLRPPWLLEARSEHKRGRLAAGRLRELEDRAVLEAIELQHRAELVSDTARKVWG
jgi:5-methyltetrahydropteroyltriglutamate--homocysteine methyltransferase